MGILLDLLAALVLGLILSALLVKGLRRRAPGPLGGFLVIFLLMTLISWAGGLWLVPVASSYWDVPWLEFAVVGFIVLLLFAAVLPARPARRTGPDATTPEEAEVEAFVAFGVVFWTVVIVLVGSIIASYHIVSRAQMSINDLLPHRAPITTRTAE